MTQHGTLPPACRPCSCESPVADRHGIIHLNNAGTYRVRLCQRCGGAYDAQRDREPLPPDVQISLWMCQRCGASNLDGYDRCTNCPRADDDWRCRECGTRSPADQQRCVRCLEGRLLILP